LNFIEYYWSQISMFILITFHSKSTETRVTPYFIRTSLLRTQYETNAHFLQQIQDTKYSNCEKTN